MKKIIGVAIGVMLNGVAVSANAVEIADISQSVAANSSVRQQWGAKLPFIAP
ncbi:MAG: hypothetical protein ACI8PW_000728 [Methylophilaceae bacterium]|jgi:hypothetical protein